MTDWRDLYGQTPPTDQEVFENVIHPVIEGHVATFIIPPRAYDMIREYIEDREELAVKRYRGVLRKGVEGS